MTSFNPHKDPRIYEDYLHMIDEETEAQHHAFSLEVESQFEPWLSRDHILNHWAMLPFCV